MEQTSTNKEAPRRVMEVCETQKADMSRHQAMLTVVPYGRAVDEYLSVEFRYWGCSHPQGKLSVYERGFSRPVAGLSASFLSHLATTAAGPLIDRLKPIVAAEVTFDRRDNKIAELLATITEPFYKKAQVHLDGLANDVIEAAYAQYATATNGNTPGRQSPQRLGRVRIFKIDEVGDSAYFMVLFGQDEAAVAGMFNLPIVPYIRLVNDNEL